MASGIDKELVTDSLTQKPIWLDCDTGHDDAFAILLASYSPGVKLLGISTVYGNAPLTNTTYNTRAVLEAVGRTDVPVYAGASRPKSREPCHAPDIHGDSGLDGTTCLPEPTVPARSDLSAVDAMYRALSEEPAGTVWLVATGALTNVAELFAVYPSLADHIAGLSIMGGAVGDGFTKAPMGKRQGETGSFGNHTPFAEFNIYCDPEAADAIFSNEVLAKKTTLIPLDLTHQFLATNQVQLGLLFGFGREMRNEPTMKDVSTVRRLFFEILTFFARTYAEVFDLTDGPPTHDPLAVAAAFRPSLFYCNVDGNPGDQQTERFKVEVVTEGLPGEHSSEVENGSISSQCGRTVVHLLPEGEHGVKIPRGLDAQQLWSMLEGCLTRTDRAIGRGAASDKREATGGQMSTKHDFAGSREQNMIDLVPNPHVTLSQFEMHAGLFPDIKGPTGNQGGEYLTTNKEASLGIPPFDPKSSSAVDVGSPVPAASNRVKG